MSDEFTRHARDLVMDGKPVTFTVSRAEIEGLVKGHLICELGLKPASITTEFVWASEHGLTLVMRRTR